MNTPLAVPARSVPRGDMRGVSAEVITTVLGLAAAIAVVAANVGLQRALDLDLLELTYAFVLPVGAILGGLGAASGYYAAARATETLPSRRIQFEMLAIALSTWMLMHWVDYATLHLDDGSLVRDALPFWDYLRIRTEHLQFSTQSAGGSPIGAPAELGMLGYLHELIQVAGFLAGGFLMFIALSTHEACTPCSRYARSTRLLQRAPSDVFDQFLSRAGIALPSLAQRVAEAVGRQRLVGMNLNLATCPSCRRSWIRPAAVVMQGRHAGPKRLTRYDIDATQAQALRRLAGS